MESMEQRIENVVESILQDYQAGRDIDRMDHFTNSTPESEWRSCLDHAEKIGLGSKEYELIEI